MEIPTINGMLSLDECMENIKLIACNLAKDISSPLINNKRVESLRALLDLFEEYNKLKCQ
jgi:hypothetical protein